DFGQMYAPQTNNSIDWPQLTGNPVISNNGTCDLNVTVTGTDLWDTVSNPTINFQYQTEVNQTDAYLEGTEVWTNVPAVSITDDIGWLQHINLSNAVSQANIHFNVSVPYAEVAGVKTSTVTLTVEKS
ncbi:MAG: hypothetical protein QF475_01160, partial [Candidatus Undinarchaeales archaeon]|nr:hypothetical protein [Candidatus Undinarchaeales archaeon]